LIPELPPLPLVPLVPLVFIITPRSLIACDASE
jgi:hypothetical protein